MDIKKTNNPNRVMYSSYRSHHSTTNRIERTERTYENQLTRSSSYLMIIDEFYHSLRQKREQMNQNKLSHKSPIDNTIDLIVAFVKSYNSHYMDLLNHDHQFNNNTHNKLIKIIEQFQFNLNQIGIRISNRNLLQVNTLKLEKKLEDSFTNIDFMFEKNGLMDQLQNLYVEKLKKSNITHFDKRI